MVRSMLSVVLLAAGCAGTSGPAETPAGPAPVQTDVSHIAAGESSNHLVLGRLGGKGVILLVGDRGITGPGVTLTRYNDASDHAIRGDAWHRVVNVDVTADGAKGVVGGGPLDVKVAMVGDELQVRGTVGGKTSTFAINPRGVTGNIGRCMFQMARQGAEYTGTRGCEASVEPSTFTFPASFGTWSLPELGAALVIVLSSGS